MKYLIFLKQLKATDWRKLVGAFVMMTFAIIAMIRWYETHMVFFLLLVFRDFLLVYFFAIRKDSETNEPLGGRIISYASAALPLCYFHIITDNGYLIVTASLLSILGFLISTLATIELADRIGFAPAKRGEICRSGVYKYIKHPMYFGYVIAEAGNILLNPLNGLVFIVSASGYWLRSKRENRVLNIKL